MCYHLLMKAYHYSLNPLSKGEVITSVQHKYHSHKLVWDIYSDVAKTLGVYFPKEYGYAYPSVRSIFTPIATLHEVSAPKHLVTRGNLNHSVMISMNRLHDFSDRSLPLADRLVKRAEALRDEAMTYFTKLDDADSIELISDAWKVRRVL